MAGIEGTTPQVESTDTAEKENKEYTVKKGDTLGEIAKKFGVSIDELAKINSIKNINFIKEGQRLIIGTKKQLPELGGEVTIQSLKDRLNNQGITIEEKDGITTFKKDGIILRLKEGEKGKFTAEITIGNDTYIGTADNKNFQINLTQKNGENIQGKISFIDGLVIIQEGDIIRTTKNGISAEINIKTFSGNITDGETEVLFGNNIITIGKNKYEINGLVQNMIIDKGVLNYTKRNGETLSGTLTINTEAAKKGKLIIVDSNATPEPQKTES